MDTAAAVRTVPWDGGFPCDALGPFDEPATVAQLLPDGYARYVRVFHPLFPEEPHPGTARTWRSLAEETGLGYHPELTWLEFVEAWWDRPGWVPCSPSEGRLDDPASTALFSLLADGHSEATFLYVYWGEVYSPPQAPVAFHAATTAIAAVEVRAGEVWGYPPMDLPVSPEFVWPDDRSWVVCTDVDLTATYVACDEATSAAILHHPSIEALLVTRELRLG